MQANSIPSSPESGTPRRACGSLTETCSKVSNVRILSVRELETKNAQLRRKVSCVEEEKACLQLENRQLISEMEAVQLELANYKTKVTILGSAVESKSSSVSLRKEQMEAMENEIEAQRIELRDWEKKHEEIHEILVIKCRLVQDLTEDLRALKAHFEDQNGRSQRIEQQRNEALSNAKKQAQAFQAYKANMTQKLKKLSENEDHLKHSLLQCDSEKVEVEGKNSSLEQEKAEMHKRISQLKEAAERSDTLKSECDSHRLQLEEAMRRSDDLAHRLEVKEAEVRETEALRRETADLRLLTTSLQQRLQQYQQEAQLSRTQLSNLEAILDLLHLRESGGVALCVSPCLLPPVPADDVPKLQPGEQYQRLLPVLRLLEQERARQTQLTRGLQERLTKTQEEASTLQTGLTQREHHLQQLQSQMQQRLSELTQLERELKKKSILLAATEKQLEEKTAAMSLSLEHSSELEHNLVEKSSNIQLLRSALDTGKKDYQTALEEAQRLHADQRTILEDQIKMLQLSVEQKGAQIAEMERTLSSTQQERQEALQRAGKLQTSLSHVSLETEANSQREQEALRSLGEQAAQYSTRVKALETALSSCQEELSRCLQQMEKAKSHFEEQLDTKSREVEFLGAELERISRALGSSSQQSQQLQHAAQQQEAMLKESSTHLIHMEANHTALLKQVEELERERALAAEELRTREQEMQQASEQADIRGREAAHLSSSVMQLTTDMSKYRGELSEREKELLLIRRASGAQASQLAHMEKMLTQTKGLLEKKTEMVQDLEEKVQRSKRDRRNSLHRTQLLETQMKTVRGELVDTLDHLQELRNVLRRSQQQAEERKAAMEKLATELREAQQELEQRNGQVKDKDIALKDKQHELQQKASQLSQLESAVQEHRTDMEQKLLHLQEAMERSERELSERNKQVAFLSERLELVQAQLQGKETLEEEALLQTQQLRECREQFQRTAQGLQEMRSRCESLSVQLEESCILGQERESQVRLLEEELTRTAEQAAQTERRLQEVVASIALELEIVRKQHQAELAALQESQAEMMKASECVSNTLRSSQELLSQELQHTRAQLDAAQLNASTLLAELRSREHLLHSTSEALLLKESEVTRLKTKISSLERGAELRSLSQSMGLSLPSLTSASAITNSPPPHRRGERRAHSPAARPWAVDGDDSAGDLPLGARDAPQSPARLTQLKADQITTLCCPLQNSLRKSLFSP